MSRPDRASRGVGPGWPGCCEGWAEGESQLGRAFGPRVGLKFSFPISIFSLFSNSNKLNPNESKFEFEFTQVLKQIKPMLQHDATTKFKLRQILITCETKLN